MCRYELRDELMFISFSTSPPPFFKIDNSCTLTTSPTRYHYTRWARRPARRGSASGRDRPDDTRVARERERTRSRRVRLLRTLVALVCAW